MMTEQRRAPRIVRHLFVRYRCLEQGQTEWRSSPLLDLSSAGARFRSERRLAAGAALEMQLLLPLRPVTLKARVVWVGSPQAGLTELGVTFAPADAAIQQQIDDAVAHFLRKQGS